MVINWETTAEETHLINAIANRAMVLFKKAKIKTEKNDLMMDLAVVHLNGCPLNFRKFLDAPALEFQRDITGIEKFLNRRTGRLEDSFMPRCAR